MNNPTCMKTNCGVCPEYGVNPACPFNDKDCKDCKESTDPKCPRLLIEQIRGRVPLALQCLIEKLVDAVNTANDVDHCAGEFDELVTDDELNTTIKNLGLVGTQLYLMSEMLEFADDEEDVLDEDD